METYNKIMGITDTVSPKYLNYPITNVSWNDASRFVSKLNALNKHAGLTGNFRMPTEAEWEYVFVKGGIGSSKLNDVSWNRNNGAKVHPVAQKKADAFGVYDMLGNVYEWCADSFSPYLKKGAGENKVLRGGDAVHEVYFVDGKVRNMEKPDKSSENIGFRIVQDVE